MTRLIHAQSNLSKESPTKQYSISSKKSLSARKATNSDTHAAAKKTPLEPNTIKPPGPTIHGKINRFVAVMRNPIQKDIEVRDESDDPREFPLNGSDMAQHGFLTKKKKKSPTKLYKKSPSTHETLIFPSSLFDIKKIDFY
jgi:hypothetical protein